MTAPQWRKSSRCDTSSCVEVAIVDGEPGGVLVRGKSKVAISFDRAEWEAFIAGAKAGEFDWPIAGTE